MATIRPNGVNTFTDNNNLPLVGGLVYTYATGTVTPLSTFADALATVPNANPIVLDAAGRATIFWSGSYKVVVKTASGALVTTIDPISDGAEQLSIDLANGVSGSKGSSLVGFLQAGTGAISRTLQAKNRDTVSVKDFGAVGDGVTDDSAAIVSGLTAAGALGVGLFFPPGNYLTAPFAIPAAVKSVQGESRASVTITIKTGTYTSGQRMIDARSNTAKLLMGRFSIAVDNVAFNATWTLDLTGGTTVRCADVAITGSGAYGIIWQGGTDIAALGCRLIGTNGGFGVGVYGNTQVSAGARYVADDVHVDGIFNYGVALGGDGVRASSANSIRFCRATGAAGAGFAFSLAGCTLSEILSCYSKDSNHEAFQLTDCYYCTISGNHAEWSTGGIDFACSIQGTAGSRFNKIIGNSFLNSNKEAIALADNTQYTLVANNVGKDCGVRAGRGALIAYTVTASAANNNNTFQGNKFANEAGNLINYFLESQGGTGAIVDSNTAQDNAFSGVFTGAKYLVVGSNTKIFDPDWISYTPAITAASGTITAYTVNSAQYRRRGKEIALQFDVTITTPGTAAGTLLVGLPFLATTGGGAVAGRETINTGYLVGGQANGANMTVVTYNNTFPASTAGSRVVCSGIYQAA